MFFKASSFRAFTYFLEKLVETIAAPNADVKGHAPKK